MNTTQLTQETLPSQTQSQQPTQQPDERGGDGGFGGPEGQELQFMEFNTQASQGYEAYSGFTQPIGGESQPANWAPSQGTAHQMVSSAMAPMGNYNFMEYPSSGQPGGDDGWGPQDSDTMQADLSGIDDIFDDEADNNDDDQGPYRYEELPEWACRYCGVHSPASCVRCGDGMWFCNGKLSASSSISCIVNHLVRSKQKEVCMRLRAAG